MKSLPAVISSAVCNKEVTAADQESVAWEVVERFPDVVNGSSTSPSRVVDRLSL